MKREIKSYGKAGKYLLYTPNYEPKGITLYLHGLGERGTDVTDVEKNEIPKQIVNGYESNNIIIAPQLIAGNGWPKSVILEMLKIMDSYGLEPHVTGLSLGGIGSLAATKIAYDRNGNKPYFKSVGVVSGKISMTQLVNGVRVPISMEPFLGTPINWWHGVSDTVLPYKNAVAFFDRFKQAGGIGKLISYQGAGHNIWPRAYDTINPESYWKWRATL